ncbi:MAG: hypothetical protein OEW77_09270 [Gemmatimonadota bacterium]|nr:hypothetical protein [Gemmatimonadota bacterium]
MRCALFASVAFSIPATTHAQRSLAPAGPRGLTITPVFEGWYRNPDGSFSLSFGYYNRNTEEVVEVPVGANNRIAAGADDRGQPSTFYPNRHWGVFAVRVPADFGKQELTWTITFRGTTTSVPGSLKPDWQIDALEGEASASNTPPTLSFGANEPKGQGPGGVTVGPRRVAVGVPLTLTVVVTDDAKTSTAASGAARAGGNVDLTWFKHQGPGDVTFGKPTARLAPAGGTATTTATFSTPGDYIVRVRANDSPVASAGHSQCCWTNGFVRVTVTP